MSHSLPADAAVAARRPTIERPLLASDELAFLHESNAIEDITGLDYRKSSAGLLQGHVAAFLHAQRLGRTRRLVSPIDLCWWQQLIVLEQRLANVHVPERGVGQYRSGFAPFNVGVGDYVPPSFSRVPALMQVWMHDLRARLLDPQVPSRMEVAMFSGQMLQRFEAIHPFVDGNGRVGRLVVAYLLAYWQLPLLIFRHAERDQFFAAHRTKAAMQAFMATKLGVVSST
jgi:Fic family protein